MRAVFASEQTLYFRMRLSKGFSHFLFWDIKREQGMKPFSEKTLLFQLLIQSVFIYAIWSDSPI